GQKPSPDEYVSRFPQWRDNLLRQFQLHELLEDEQSAAKHLLSLPLASGSDGGLEHFELLRKLGHGWTGVVSQARQVSRDRVVVLKLFSANELLGPEERERFRRGAEDQARLRHPHIVEVHEVGDADGLPFFVMEFAEGGGLDRKIAGKPQPAEETARLLHTLAETMQFAHEQRIVHRDLKPGNVVLTADGAPKLTGLGLGVGAGSRCGLTP